MRLSILLVLAAAVVATAAPVREPATRNEFRARRNIIEEATRLEEDYQGLLKRRKALDADIATCTSEVIERLGKLGIKGKILDYDANDGPTGSFFFNG